MTHATIARRYVRENVPKGHRYHMQAALNEFEFGNVLDAGISTFDDGRYLLVEANLGSASGEQPHYFSTHRTVENAGLYWVAQEYREEWDPVVLVDLETGQRYEPELRLVFA